MLYYIILYYIILYYIILYYIILYYIILYYIILYYIILYYIILYYIILYYIILYYIILYYIILYYIILYYIILYYIILYYIILYYIITTTTINLKFQKDKLTLKPGINSPTTISTTTLNPKKDSIWHHGPSRKHQTLPTWLTETSASQGSLPPLGGCFGEGGNRVVLGGVCEQDHRDGVPGD